MAPFLVKANAIPTIQSMHTTCAGDQYTVVTITNTCVTCTCGETACPHSQLVTARRDQDAAQAERRAIYEMLFDLSYGDTVA